MTRFYKLSGAGNDFIALVRPAQAEAAPVSPNSVRAWCQRSLSLGADGLFELTQQDGLARMVHYNADGGRSDLCLNGSRCAAQLAFQLGWAETELALETDAGVLRARAVSTSRVQLSLPELVDGIRPLTMEVGEHEYAAFHLRVGVPHLVLPWEQTLDLAPVSTLGRQLRHHAELGPEGANVSFVRFPSLQRAELRTFERGVEAETLACGTGAVAVAAVGLAQGWLQTPVTLLTAGGFELGVQGQMHEGRLQHATLEGDARLVASGDLHPGAQQLPQPPVWRQPS